MSKGWNPEGERLPQHEAGADGRVEESLVQGMHTAEPSPAVWPSLAQPGARKRSWWEQKHSQEVTPPKGLPRGIHTFFFFFFSFPACPDFMI